MRYAVKFPNRSVEKKFLRTLSSVFPKEIQNQLKEKTLSLSDNPRPYGQLKIKPPVEIYTYVAQYRLRVGDYRALYDVDDRKKIVWILALRKRNEQTY